MFDIVRFLKEQAEQRPDLLSRVVNSIFCYLTVFCKADFLYRLIITNHRLYFKDLSKKIDIKA